MTSKLASEDLADLRAEGLTPTDEDIIRLHALALRLTDGPETTSANAPRWAIVGGVVFWEPTIAAYQFYEFAKSFCGWRLNEDWLFAFACANGRRVGYLQGLQTPDVIRREVRAWLRTVAATKSEVETAVYYVSTGYDDIKAELTEMSKKRAKTKTAEDRERENYATVEMTLQRAAAATGLTLSDLLAQTHSRLLGMIYAAHVQAGMEMTKSASGAHADYLATLHAIRARLLAEKSVKS